METIFKITEVADGLPDNHNGQLVFINKKGEVDVFQQYNPESEGDERFMRNEATHWLKQVALPTKEEIEAGCGDYLKSVGMVDGKQFIAHDWNVGVQWLLNWLHKK